MVSIWQLNLENDFGVYRKCFFLTRRALNRYLKKHKQELERPNTTWCSCEQSLYLW